MRSVWNSWTDECEVLTLEVIIFYSTIDLKWCRCKSNDAFAFWQLGFALTDVVKQVVISLVQYQKVLRSNVVHCFLQPNDRNNLDVEEQIQVTVNLFVGLVKDIRGEANKNAFY